MGKSLKGKELGKGISQRKDGLYQARFINRFGKRQTIYAKTYNDITKKLRDAQYEDEKQINVVTSNITLDEWYNVWMTTCKKHCRDTTRRTYSVQYNRLREELGWRKLTNLNLVIIQNAFNNLKSDKSRKDCKALLVDMLNRAFESDLVNKNVAVSVNTKIDGTEQPEKRVLTPDEIQILYQSTRNSQLYPFFVLALNTGMRMGEILGLTWECVDFETGFIHVEKTLCYLPNNGTAIYEFHPPKSKAGKRNIPMSKQVMEILQEQKAWRDKVNSRFKAQPGFGNLVFTSKTNHPLHESNIRTAIRYLVNRINTENPAQTFETFTPHCLRHTFATNCITKGMRPKTLQKLLGHNSLQMTMDLYCHVLDSTLKDEMSIITEMV
ncbi:MAG: tyrosine-type recombinase/integrase [Clostridiales bacterium]|nr:tyrosine-type recombinase/integrase [Clostridiales bacterium]